MSFPEEPGACDPLGYVRTVGLGFRAGIPRRAFGGLMPLLPDRGPDEARIHGLFLVAPADWAAAFRPKRDAHLATSLGYDANMAYALGYKAGENWANNPSQNPATPPDGLSPSLQAVWTRGFDTALDIWLCSE